MYLCVSVCTESGDHRSHKKALDCLELELQPVEGCPIVMLETEPGSSARAISTFSHRVLSPSPGGSVLVHRQVLLIHPS